MINKRFPKYAMRFLLLRHSSPMQDILDGLERPYRPGYFDYNWEEVFLPLDKLCDRVTGFDIRALSNPSLALNTHFEEALAGYDPVYVDGFYAAERDDGGIGVFIPTRGHLFGQGLLGCSSSLSSKYKAIYRSLREITLLQIHNSVVCSDSLVALNVLVNRIAEASLEPIVYRIVEKGKALIDSGLVWVGPSHFGSEGQCVEGF